MSLYDIRQTLENIEHQKNPAFFDKLTDIIASLRKEKINVLASPRGKRIIEQSGLAKLIFDHKGIALDISVPNVKTINAAVFFPRLDRNHPLLNDLQRIHLPANDLNAFIKKKYDMKGYVDLRTGKVSGIYSKVVCKCKLYQGIMDPEFSGLSDRMVTAILLHELGHVSTYFIYMGNLLTMSHVLRDGSELLTKTKDPQLKHNIVKASRHHLNLKGDGADADIRTPKSYQSVIVSDVYEASASATGSDLYDMRTWEALADQYVVREGGARDLALGLDKIYRRYGERAINKRWQNNLMDLLSLPFLAAISPLLLLVMMTTPRTDAYDNPKDRIGAIRRDIVNSLKDLTLTQEQRKTRLEDLKILQDLENQYRNDPGPLVLMWNFLNATNRQQGPREEFVKQMERLANNDLYVVAAKAQAGETS